MPEHEIRVTLRFASVEDAEWAQAILADHQEHRVGLPIMGINSGSVVYGRITDWEV